MNLSTRQLEAFLLVARLASFTRAAEHAHMTQAGLSATIRDLENQFSCRLFDRTTRSVRLTGEGRALLPFAERITNELRAAAGAVQASAATSKSVLSIAVTPIAATTLIAAACREFKAAMPDVEVRVKDVQQPDIQRLVETGDVDIGLTIFLKPASNIDALSVMSFRLVCVAPRGTLKSRPARRGPELRWEDLPDLALITLPSTTELQPVIDMHLMQNTKFKGQRTSYNSMQTIVAMVSGGQGMAILPSMVVPACDPSQLDIAYLERPVVRLPFFRIARKGSRLPDAASAFVDALKSSGDACG